MRIVPPARADGLSAQAGRPPFNSVVIAALLGMLALIIGLGFCGALIAAALVATASCIIGRLCIKQIGGQTGDVLGAVEQVSEILILLVAAAWLDVSYFCTVEVMEAITSEAILNSLSRLVMP